VGDANPNFQMSLSNDLTWKQFGFAFLFDWKQGGDIINLTQFLFDLAKNSPDYLEAGADRLDRWSNGETAVYVQDGSYLKLREVTLAYTLPDKVTRSLFGGLRYARLSVSGRNLLRFTGYVGLDPEVSNFANQAIVRNIDVAPFPPNKSVFFGVDLGF
jgi:TonB-dependent starch-binding outer membrane protein SusC